MLSPSFFLWRKGLARISYGMDSERGPSTGGGVPAQKYHFLDPL
jgi:hypothetical protein